MKKHIVISVLAEDRTGIIADVANLIYDLKGDLADMSQSVLNGFFSMIILARFDKDISAEQISQSINKLKSSGDLSCIVKETDETSLLEQASHGDIYVVTAQGKNRTGLVATVSTFCRDNGINILGYETTLNKDVYSMMLDIELPDNISADSIHEKLDKLGEDLGLKTVMQHKDLFETVNEVSLF